MGSRSLPGLLLPLVLWANAPGCTSDGLTRYGFRVVNSYPHDREAYCQGLLFDGGYLYESTGRNGTSSVRRVELESGEVLAQFPLPYQLFGEGLALHGNELYQLTWESGKGHVFTKDTLEVVRQFTYEGEGWGLTSDGEHLIMSDGSSFLTFRDPATFEEVRRVRVRYQEKPVEMLNELEYVDGRVWANVWKSEQIAMIDPETGNVEAYLDIAGLFDYSKIDDMDAVPNGIAWDAEGKRLFLTGKLWPKLFEVELTKP